MRATTQPCPRAEDLKPTTPTKMVMLKSALLRTGYRERPRFDCLHLLANLTPKKVAPVKIDVAKRTFDGTKRIDEHHYAGAAAALSAARACRCCTWPARARGSSPTP